METRRRSLPEPILNTSALIPADAKIVIGVVAPTSPDPIPFVLLPGFEYRLREWRPPRHPRRSLADRRRKSAQHGDYDE
jgi:hypothetical protein